MAQEAQGSQTATVGTEHSLDTITTEGKYTATVDTSALGQGDRVRVKEYLKVNSAGTKRVLRENTFAYDPSEPNIETLPLSSKDECEYTLEQIQGTFTVTSMTGTVAEGDTVTGATSGAVGRVIQLDDLATPTSVVMFVETGTAFQDSENAEVDGSNYLVLNDATPALSFNWTTQGL